MLRARLAALGKRVRLIDEWTLDKEACMHSRRDCANEELPPVDNVNQGYNKRQSQRGQRREMGAPQMGDIQ